MKWPVSVIKPVHDGPVGEERGEALPAGLDQVRLAAHVQKALVLAREARAGQILGGRRAADGHRQASAAYLFEFAVGCDDLRAQGFAAGRRANDLARIRGPCSQQIEIAPIDAVQQLAQRGPSSRGRQGVAVGLRGDGETLRNPHAFTGKGAIEFAERSGLAANQGDVAPTQVLEPSNIGWSGHLYLSQWREVSEK